MRIWIDDLSTADFFTRGRETTNYTSRAAHSSCSSNHHPSPYAWDGHHFFHLENIACFSELLSEHCSAEICSHSPASVCKKACTRWRNKHIYQRQSKDHGRASMFSRIYVPLVGSETRGAREVEKWLNIKTSRFMTVQWGMWFQYVCKNKIQNSNRTTSICARIRTLESDSAVEEHHSSSSTGKSTR